MSATLKCDYLASRVHSSIHDFHPALECSLYRNEQFPNKSISHLTNHFLISTKQKIRHWQDYINYFFYDQLLTTCSNARYPIPTLSKLTLWIFQRASCLLSHSVLFVTSNIDNSSFVVLLAQ